MTIKESLLLLIEIYKDSGTIVYVTFIPLLIGAVIALYTHKIRYFLMSISLITLFILGLTIYLFYSGFTSGQNGSLLPFL